VYANGGSAATAQIVPTRVRSTFAHFDANGSGYLDYRELQNALRHYGVDLSTEGARAMVVRYDDRPDGKLDVGEFAELVRDIEAGVIRSGTVLADNGAGIGAVGSPPRSGIRRLGRR